MKKIIFFTLFYFLAFSVSLSVSEEGYYYRYTDKEGKVHIVDSEMLVPYANKDTMEKIPLGKIPVVNGISEENGKNDEKSFEEIYDSDLIKYKSKRSEMESLIKKKKDLREKYNIVKKEHDIRVLRHPDFYHQTFAAKRKKLKELKENMNDIEEQISGVDREIEELKESSRREGIPAQWLEVDEEAGEEME